MATSAINASGIKVGNDGKVNVSGLSSNIDSKAIIDAQMAARRAPAVRLETRITANNTLASAYEDLRSKTSTIATSLDKLRSAPGSSTDVFNAKTTSGSTAAIVGAPPGHVPSSTNSLLLTSIGANAQNGTHTVTIQQLATAQQIRADALTSTTSTLDSLGIPAGNFVLNGKTITVSATDTLQDLRANINAAGANVNASIVSAGATTHYLVLTSSLTGSANTLTFSGSNTIPAALGLTTGGGLVKTQLTAAQNAVLDVNGITGITRSSNAVDDVLTGVTLNLLKSEPNTVATLKIEPDLNAIKTALGDFVESYNELRSFFTEQRTPSDRNNDGRIGDNEVGPLAYDQRLRDITNRLSQMVSTSVGSNADGFRSLSQLGIEVDSAFRLSINDATLDNRLLSNVGEVRKLFGFQATSSDSRLTITSRTSATQSGTYYINLGGTDGSGNVISANVRATAGTGTGGAADGSVTVSGSLLTGATGNSTGLGAFFGGTAGLGPVNDIAVTITRGLADQFYDALQEQSKPSSGGLATAITELQLQNNDYSTRVAGIDSRIVTVRANLEARFVRMETALAQLETLRTTIQSFIDSNNSSN